MTKSNILCCLCWGHISYYYFYCFAGGLVPVMWECSGLELLGRPIRTILVLLYGTAMGIDLGALWVEGICSRSVSYHTSSVIYILSSKSHCYLKFSDLLVLIIMVQSESFPSIFFPIFFCDLRMLSEIVQGGRLFQGVKVCENTRHDPNPFLIRLYIIFLQPDCPVFLDCQHVSASSGFTQTKNKLYNIATM